MPYRDKVANTSPGMMTVSGSEVGDGQPRGNESHLGERSDHQTIWEGALRRRRGKYIGYGGWDAITKSNEEGGSGIRSAEARNLTLLGSMARRAQGSERPSARFLWHK